MRFKSNTPITLSFLVTGALHIYNGKGRATITQTRLKKTKIILPDYCTLHIKVYFIPPSLRSF